MMFPSEDVGRLIDSPRKASEPSSTMAMATPMSANDTAAGTMLGSSSRNKMRDVLAPVARAATTNSRLANDSVVARMTRKSRGAETKANIKVSFHSTTGFQKASMTMTASRAGKAISTKD